MPYLTTDALIIHKRKFNDHDYFVTFLTQHNGKMNGIMKGSNKITAKYLCHIEPLNLNQLTLYLSPKNIIITQSSIKESYHTLKKNYHTIKVILSFCELIYFLIPEEQITPLFALTIEHLDQLKTNHANAELILASYKIKLIDCLGILGSFDVCGGCRKPHPFKKNTSNFFGYTVNGLICHDCFHTHTKRSSAYQIMPCQEISPVLIKLFRFLKNKHPHQIINLIIEAHHTQKINQITTTIINHHLQRELKSEKYYAHSTGNS